MQPENIFPSVEALKERHQVDGTSLGLVKPAEVIEVTSHRVSERERSDFMDFMEHYREAVQQMDLPLDLETGREIRPLRAADYRFRVHFRCNDPRCQAGHKFSVLDWEIDSLYFRLRTQQKRPPYLAARGVVEKLQEICGPQKDAFFFLGNIASHPRNSTIVGLWYPKKTPQDPQLRLF